MKKNVEQVPGTQQHLGKKVFLRIVSDERRDLEKKFTTIRTLFTLDIIYYTRIISRKVIGKYE